MARPMPLVAPLMFDQYTFFLFILATCSKRGTSRPVIREAVLGSRGRSSVGDTQRPTLRQQPCQRDLAHEALVPESLTCFTAVI